MYILNRGGANKPATYSHFEGLAPRRNYRPLVVFLSLLVLLGGGAFFVLKPTHASESLNKDSTETVVPPAPKLTNVKPLKEPQASEVPYLDTQLQDFLNNWSIAHPGTDWAVVVQGLGSDRRYASTRANSWYVPASVYKLMMTYTLFQRTSREEMRYIKVPVAGGKSQTLEACVEAMLKYSDNPCGEAVGKYLGWWRIESDLHKLGYKDTYVNRTDSMFSTVSDAASYMEDLYQGKLMSNENRDYILSLLKQQRFRLGIPKGCQDCTVADKTGDLVNVRHDVALVQSGGKTYVLAVFTSGAPYSQIAELTKQINAYMSIAN